MAIMKFAIVFVIVLIGITHAQKYTSKYDNVDLDQILRSDRLLRNYVNCLLDKVKCTPDALELKKSLPDALQNGCSRCSEKQRSGAKKVLHYLIENKRSWWNELEGKYDPQGTYRRKYEQEAKREGIHF